MRLNPKVEVALLVLESETMHKFPDDVVKIMQSVSHCAKQNGFETYLHGDLLLYHLTGDKEFLQPKTIDFVISYSADFNTNKFYKSLIQHVVINREVENSDNKYCFISDGFEVKMDIVKQFDPTKLVQSKLFGSFNLDMLFYNPDTDSIEHPADVVDDFGVLMNMKDPNSWVFEDVLGFAMWMGRLPNLKVDPQQLNKLLLMSLGTLKESMDITWQEQMENILLLRRSGSALRFIANTFADGATWTFKTLVDYMISAGIGINDESDIDTVFNEKKFDTIDLYNEFFLDRTTPESADDIHHRLTTTMKLLFDSPNLDIPRPYVNRIKTMGTIITGRCCLGTDVGGSIAPFGCGNNMTQIDCEGLHPTDCAGGNECLQNHPAFSHIPEENWEFLQVDYREWCPDQVCPETDNHCLSEN